MYIYKTDWETISCSRYKDQIVKPNNFNNVNLPNFNNMILEIYKNNMLGIEHESYLSKIEHIQYLYITFPYYNRKSVKFEDSGYRMD